METYVVHPDKLQEKALKAFLEALEVPYEVKSGEEILPAHVSEGVREGQKDIEYGRCLTLEEFKTRIAST